MGVGVLLGGILRVGAGDLGASADDALRTTEFVLLLLFSSGVAGSARRTGPGECDNGADRLPLASGAADVFVRLSRIEPVRTKFLRCSATGAPMLSALAVSVRLRRLAAALLDLRSDVLLLLVVVLLPVLLTSGSRRAQPECL